MLHLETTDLKYPQAALVEVLQCPPLWALAGIVSIKQLLKLAVVPQIGRRQLLWTTLDLTGVDCSAAAFTH